MSVLFGLILMTTILRQPTPIAALCVATVAAILGLLPSIGLRDASHDAPGAMFIGIVPFVLLLGVTPSTKSPETQWWYSAGLIGGMLVAFAFTKRLMTTGLNRASLAWPMGLAMAGASVFFFPTSPFQSLLTRYLSLDDRILVVLTCLYLLSLTLIAPIVIIKSFTHHYNTDLFSVRPLFEFQDPPRDSL